MTMHTPTSAAELAAAARTPFPAKRRIIATPGRRCSPRRSSCAATSSGSPRSAARCRRRRGTRRITLPRRERQRGRPRRSVRPARHAGHLFLDVGPAARAALPDVHLVRSARSTASAATSSSASRSRSSAARRSRGSSPSPASAAGATSSSTRPSATTSPATTAALVPTAAKGRRSTCLASATATKVRLFWAGRGRPGTADPGLDAARRARPDAALERPRPDARRAAAATGIRSSATEPRPGSCRQAAPVPPASDR